MTNELDPNEWLQENDGLEVLEGHMFAMCPFREARCMCRPIVDGYGNVMYISPEALEQLREEGEMEITESHKTYSEWLEENNYDSKWV